MPLPPRPAVTTPRAEPRQDSRLFWEQLGAVSPDSQPANQTARRATAWGWERVSSRAPPCWGCPGTWDRETSLAGHVAVKDSAEGNTTAKVTDLPNLQPERMRVRSSNDSCIFSLTFLTATLCEFHFSGTSHNRHRNNSCCFLSSDNVPDLFQPLQVHGFM